MLLGVVSFSCRPLVNAPPKPRGPFYPCYVASGLAVRCRMTTGSPQPIPQLTHKNHMATLHTHSTRPRYDTAHATYNSGALRQPLGQRSAYNTIIADPGSHISMYNLPPVYIPYFLQVLSLPYFTSTTPNKDQQKEQLFYCPFVLDLYPGDAHGLCGSRLAACVFHAPRKTHAAKRLPQSPWASPGYKSRTNGQ